MSTKNSLLSEIWEYEGYVHNKMYLSNSLYFLEILYDRYDLFAKRNNLPPYKNRILRYIINPQNRKRQRIRRT